MTTSQLARRWAAIACVVLSATSLTCLGQTTTRAPTSASHARATSSAHSSTYKGIFEPINYPDDLTFLDVYFINDQVGWISGHGSGGMIMHTVDGGQHWDLQLGDPKSNEPEINNLRFLDATHGWALQAGKLLQTTDGKTWQAVGTYQNPFAQYLFTTPRDGFEAFGYYSGSTITATHDGGRSWHDVFKCSTTLQIQGLTQNVSCMIFDLQFPSAQVGYGVGGAFNGGYAVVAKTEDAGATWKIIFASTDVDTANGVFFQDENHGVVRTKGRVLVTADGGRTWQGASGSPGVPLKFADPSVGWSCAARTCSYTVDGGQNWVARDIPMPADFLAFSLPRRDRAYLVGQHGLIYHYRLVPVDYAGKGMVDGPLMPAYGGALRGNLDQMTSQISALQARLSAGTSPASSINSGTSSLSGGTPASNAAMASGTSTSSSSGASAQTTGSPDTNFSQDTSVAASASMQSCCAAQVQDLQTSVATLGQQVPTFSGQFRNLNLPFVGVNMFSDLATQAQSIHQAFLTLKQAPNSQAALTAVQTLSTQLASASQTIDSQFQNLTAANPASANSLSNMANSAASDTTAPAQSTGTSQSNGTATQTPSAPSANPLDAAAKKAKEALKKIIPF